MTNGPEDYQVHSRNEYDLPLMGLAGAGVKLVSCGKQKSAKYVSDNWAEVYIESELAHAEDLRKLSERFVSLDLAYRTKLRKTEQDYASALEQGFEEAYKVVSEVQKELKALKEELNRCYRVMEACCPGELPKGYCGKNEIHTS